MLFRLKLWWCLCLIERCIFRCNFALMLLAELVLDQASVDWAQHLPLMLHVIFLGELSVLLDESQNARRNQIN